MRAITPTQKSSQKTMCTTSTTLVAEKLLDKLIPSMVRCLCKDGGDSR